MLMSIKRNYSAFLPSILSNRRLEVLIYLFYDTIEIVESGAKRAARMFKLFLDRSLVFGCVFSDRISNDKKR
jgi:hypothetical protein